ncbi:hypothetical protein ACIRTB_12205 [Streptomyces sp. NPDC101158]|uniref:hypothetical protein n=1 Tax=Streptomyces sp. NPDC101158 TaxID=3366117 RepID=UPI003830C9D6
MTARDMWTVDRAGRDLAVHVVGSQETQEDPLPDFEPYGEDDGIIRTVDRGDVTAAILCNNPASTLTVLTTAYAAI